MNKTFGSLCLFALCGASLLAQTAEKPAAARPAITQKVRMDAQSASPTPDDQPDTTQPPILNVLTVIGNDVLGLPCLDCLLNFLVPNLALPSPIAKALRGTGYQIDSYLIDNSYNGNCTFTLAISDHQNNVIASVTQTLRETAGSDILLSTPITIPTNAGIGLGTVSNTAVCGSNTTVSKSPVTLLCVNNPPFCVD